MPSNRRQSFQPIQLRAFAALAKEDSYNTRVGVNRAPTKRSQSGCRRPHTRGGEPDGKPVELGPDWSSAHPWG